MTEKRGEGRPGPVILATNAQSCSGLDARRAGVEPRQCILGHSRSRNRSPGPRFQPTVNYKAGGTARCRPGCPRVAAPRAKPVMKPACGAAAEPRGPRAGGQAHAPPRVRSESSRGRRAGAGGVAFYLNEELEITCSVFPLCARQNQIPRLRPPPPSPPRGKAPSTADSETATRQHCVWNFSPKCK